MLPYTLADAKELLAGVPEEKRSENWWLILPDRTPVAGNHGGGILLLKAMRSTRWLGRLLGWLHLSRALDLLDDLFARWRSKLSPLVPKGPAPCRYP